MNMFDDLIKIDNKGNMVHDQWIEWKHVSFGSDHCLVCLALDKCWFNDSLKPMLPQHEHCHCRKITISRPIANINSHASCDIKKFTDYIFSDKYAWNGKRDLFHKLGFTKKRFGLFKKRV